jgi:uncharacterized protein (TIGR03435 family)
MTLLPALAVAALALGPAQTPAPAAPRVEFEVATVRPVTAAQAADGSVTLGFKMDGAQMRVGLPMRDLLSIAYRVKAYQIIAPEWVTSERFDINAKIPAGVSPEKMPEMLQSLLSDRFGIRLHREKKEMPVYALLMGKPPLRMRESVINPNEPPPAAVAVTGTGSAAGVSVNLGNGSYYSFMLGKFEAKKFNADTIAVSLERYVDRPVMNLTDLKGTYDFEFTVTPEDNQTLMIRAAINAGVKLPPQALQLLDNGGNPLESAAEQLGLKLDSRRMPVEVIVIDQISKTPTEN